MSKRYYLDTSIWLDIIEKRGKNSEIAKQLMKKIIFEDDIVVYSDFIIIEFKDLGYSQQEINTLLGMAKPDNIERVHIYKEQIEEANKLSKQKDIPKKDILHAILCRDNFLQLISRDKHFMKLKNVTTTKKPEEII